MFGISIGLGILNLLPIVGAIIAIVVSVWISIIWLYVLPLIADQGLSFTDAAGRSNQMVKSAGWWWTFGMVILLGLAALIVVALIAAIAMGLYGASDAVGISAGVLLFLVFAVLFPPYSICYISVLYVASGGDIAIVPAGGGMGAAPPPPPASPSYGGTAMTASYTAPPAGAQAGADAWKAAADPLSAPPPPPPLSAPMMPSTDSGATAVTDVTPPEPPPAPAPPAGGS
jgi:hypothetical protein